MPTLVGVAAVKHEADALRQRLGSLGAVNLVAIEEYAEFKERHGFLKTQVADRQRKDRAIGCD